MNYAIKLVLLIFGISILVNTSQGQNISISDATATPDDCAVLDVESDGKGMLIPRLTLLSYTDQATIYGATTTTSLLVYNQAATNIPIGFYYWNGSAWDKIASNASGGGSTTTYGNMNEYQTTTPTTISIPSNSIYYGWISASSGNVNNVSFTDNSTADRLTISQAGTYLVNVSVSFALSTAKTLSIYGCVHKNDSPVTSLLFQRSFSASNNTGSASLNGIITLAASDYLDLRFSTTNDANSFTVNIYTVNFTITKID